MCTGQGVPPKNPEYVGVDEPIPDDIDTQHEAFVADGKPNFGNPV